MTTTTEHEALRKYQEITLYKLWPKGMSSCQDAWVEGYLKSHKRSVARNKCKAASKATINRAIHRDVAIHVNR